VNTKQHLFDNVVNEDATEDVVGVSKKMLDTLIEELASPTDAGPVEPLEEVELDETQASDMQRESKARPLDEAVRDCIKGLQEAFGPRIERIFGSQGSLIAVIDRIDGEAEQVAIDLSKKVPVALIDLMTLSSLNRLGAASPLAQVQTYYDVTQDRTSVDGPSRLATMAEEKFNGAKLLMGQGLHTSALELLLSAQLAAAADRAGLDVPKAAAEAGVWVYSEAIPKGILTQAEAGLIMQAVGLSQAPAVPEMLMDQLMKDTAAFMTQ
jgi:hypothetical protein